MKTEIKFDINALMAEDWELDDAIFPLSEQIADAKYKVMETAEYKEKEEEFGECIEHKLEGVMWKGILQIIEQFIRETKIIDETLLDRLGEVSVAVNEYILICEMEYESGDSVELPPKKEIS